MNTELSQYNPHFQYNDSASFFQRKIMYQDEVPVIFAKDNDSLFFTNQIIQSNISKSVEYQKSIFTSHELKAKSQKLHDLPLNYSNWSAALLLFCLVVFSSVQYNNYKRLQQVIKAFAVPRFFSQLARESNSFTERPTLILFSLYIILLSFFIAQLYIIYSGISVGLAGFYMFIKVLSGVSLFYIIKIGLISFTGKIFKAGKEAADYILNVYLFGQTMVLVVLPFTVLVTYNYSQGVIWVFLLIFSISYIYRILRGLVFISASLKVPVYYLFIYLCTLEILPLVILFKYVLLMLD